MAGNYKSPGFGLNKNCSKIYPDIRFTLYLPEKVLLEREDLINQTFDINIMAVNDEEFEVKYRGGDKYIYHGDDSKQKSWSDAENHCNQQKNDCKSRTIFFSTSTFFVYISQLKLRGQKF